VVWVAAVFRCGDNGFAEFRVTLNGV